MKEWCEGQGAQGRGNGEVGLEKTDLKTTALTDKPHPEEPTNDGSPSALLDDSLLELYEPLIQTKAWPIITEMMRVLW